MFSAMLTISARTFARFSSTASTTINPSMVSMALFSAPGDAIGRSKTTRPSSNNSKTKALIGSVTTVDTSKVDEALEVTDLSESDLYKIDESQYVRKADVDEERKESRLQGLKDQLAAAESPETDELQREIEDLEARIDELTSFSSASEVD